MEELVSWLGYWLGASYSQYLIALDAHPEQRQTVGIPLEREGEGDPYVHASTLDSCPKWAAVDRLKIRKKVFTPQERQNMEIGKRAAELFTESIVWGKQYNNPLDYQLILNTELYMDPAISQLGGEVDNCSGRIDTLLTASDGRAQMVAVPLEFKWTTMWKHAGLAKSHLMQVALYMKRLQGLNMQSAWRMNMTFDPETMPGKYGFVVTLYQGLDAPEAFHIWLIRRESYQQGYRYVVCDLDGNPLLVEGLPGNQFMSFVTDAELEYAIQDRREWFEQLRDNTLDLTDTAPYEHWTHHWGCGFVKAPEYYKKGSVDKVYGPGDKKPNTGFLRVRCPAFDLCWKSQLDEAGITDLSGLVELEDDDGELVFEVKERF